MKTLIWKELRENFKWALLALLCLAAAEIYTLSAQHKNPDFGSGQLTLCSSAFLLVTSFGSCAVGAALGIMQIIPELRRDQWAALLHRPVSRSTIFFGKAFAGLLLYAFAVIPPFLASAFYAATPGQFPAPLVPGMLRPGTSDLLFGTVFYFAALLLCLYRGRWWGGRGLLGLSLPPLFLLHLNAGWPFLLPVIAGAVFLLAARGVMLGNGRAKGQSLASRISLMLAMLVGAEAALGILYLGLKQLPPKSVPPPYLHFGFKITKDGRVFIQTLSNSGSVLTDADGKVVTDERYVGNDSDENFCQITPLSQGFEKRFTGLDRFLGSQPRNERNYVESVAQNRSNTQELWYYLPRENYFIGYDNLSRRCVGICDREGFKSVGAAPKPFPGRLRSSMWNYTSPYLYSSGPQLYTFDFPERKMTLLFDAGNGTVCGALHVEFIRDEPGQTAIALRDGLRIVDSRGTLLLSIPYPRDPAIWGFVVGITSTPVNGTFYLSSAANPFIKRAAPLPFFLDQFDLKGNLLHSDQCPSSEPYKLSPGWADRLFADTLPFAPAFASAVYQKFSPTLLASLRGLSMLPDFSPANLPILFAIAVVLAAVAFFWTRRVGFTGPQTRRWTLFVFCFGLPGLMVLRLASGWPVRERCPKCGRKRPVETDDCPFCHQAWPLPEENGAEIFDGVG